MYFLNEDERRLLMKGLLPRARACGVADELRGWNWDHPPLEPPYDTVRLGVAEVAGRYCPTGRDVYLERVLGIRPEPSEAMQSGQSLHEVVADVVVRAKQALYGCGGNSPLKALSKLEAPPGLGDQARELWAFELRRITSRVEDLLSRQPHINPDALVSLAVPVVVEVRLDGTPLGLSPHLRVDAVALGEPMVYDVKFGEPRDFHALSLAGYALAMEATYEYPVNLGCLAYARYVDGRWTMERQFHVIDERLRQWFIEVRDEKQHMVFSELDPGLPPRCPQDCPFLSHCHGPGAVPVRGRAGRRVTVSAPRSDAVKPALLEVVVEPDEGGSDVGVDLVGRTFGEKDRREQ